MWRLALSVLALAVACGGSLSKEDIPDGKGDGDMGESPVDLGNAPPLDEGPVCPPDECVLVSHVIDGDTFRYQGGKNSVRLRGIDSSEMETDKKPAQPCSGQARSALASLIGNNCITIWHDKQQTDPWGRELGWVSLCEDNKNGSINVDMVRMGWACMTYWAKGSDFEYELLDAQQEAETNRAGCWGREYDFFSDFCREGY